MILATACAAVSSLLWPLLRLIVEITGHVSRIIGWGSVSNICGTTSIEKCASVVGRQTSSDKLLRLGHCNDTGSNTLCLIQTSPDEFTVIIELFLSLFLKIIDIACNCWDTFLPLLLCCWMCGFLCIHHANASRSYHLDFRLNLKKFNWGIFNNKDVFWAKILFINWKVGYC